MTPRPLTKNQRYEPVEYPFGHLTGSISSDKPHVQLIYGYWTITKGKDNFNNPYVRGKTIPEAWNYWAQLYNGKQLIWGRK